MGIGAVSEVAPDNVGRDETLEALLEQCRQTEGRDRDAVISRVIDLTQSRLFRFCFHLCGHRQGAEDLSQEAFVKAFRQLGTLRDTGGFMTWLYRIARNHYLDEQRRLSSGEEVTADGELGDEVISDTPEAGQTQDSNLEVRRALLQLEAGEREVLILVDMEEYSYSEAAEIIGVSENAVRSRVHRARQAFLEIIQKDETKTRAAASGK